MISRYAFLWLTFTAWSLSSAEPLKIVVLEGDGAINNIRLQRAKDPVVRVETETGEPVQGAVVHFLAPATGPGASFPDGNASSIAITGPDGRAVAHGLRPNQTVGQFHIRVTASHIGSTANATITQTNAAPAQAGWNSSRKIAILAIVGGAIAGGAALAARGGGGSKSASSAPAPASGTVITAGAPSFGAP